MVRRCAVSVSTALPTRMCCSQLSLLTPPTLSGTVVWCSNPYPSLCSATDLPALQTYYANKYYRTSQWFFVCSKGAVVISVVVRAVVTLGLPLLLPSTDVYRQCTVQPSTYQTRWRRARVPGQPS